MEQSKVNHLCFSTKPVSVKWQVNSQRNIFVFSAVEKQDRNESYSSLILAGVKQRQTLEIACLIQKNPICKQCSASAADALLPTFAK